MEGKNLNRILLKTLLLWITVGCLWPALPVKASPYHYVQILPGVDPYHTMISDATKDASGMIWLVAGGMLYRYDGVNVVPFSRIYKGTIPFDEVSKLTADPWGRLWIGTRNGLFIFDTNTWAMADGQHPMARLVGKALIAFYPHGDALYVADGDGNVWKVGESAINRLFRFNANAVNERWPLGKILIADHDNLWLAFSNKLHRFDLHTGNTQVADFPAGFFRELEDVLPVKGGALIRFYAHGYWVYDGDRFRALPRKDFRGNDYTTWNHWSFTSWDKVIVFHENTYLEYSRDTAFRLLRTSTHNIDDKILYKRLNAWQFGQDEWLLATNHGLFSVFPSRIAFNFMGGRTARGMVKQRDTYYFGGYGYLYTWSSNRVFGPYTAARENDYYAFLPLSADTTAIAMESDFLNYLIGGRVTKAPLRVPDTVPERFSALAYCVARQSADTLLVGTSNGIWQYAISSGQATPLKSRQHGFFTRGARIQSISVQGGRISYTTNEGFFVWQQQKPLQKVYPRDSSKLHVYAHTYEGDSVYLATKGRGLVVLHPATGSSRILRTEQGLASNIVYSMKWVDGALFLGTHSGMSVYRDGQFFNYYSADGLPFEEFNHSAIYYDPDDDWLFMGGTGGYTYFHPSELLRPYDDLDIRPVLSGIRMGMKTNRYVDDHAGMQQLDTISLSSDVVWLSMDFARPNAYRQVYRMQFKVAPLMDAYQDMPNSSQINLTGLSAGNYQLSVRIQTVNSGAEGTVRTWLIHKKPVFTETLTFYGLLCIGIAGVLAFFLYERARRTKNEYRLRGKISRDLHDEVGGLLTGISMQADLLRLKAAGAEDSDARPVLAIGENSRQATQMMDDIIWAVDARNNDQESLTDRMKHIATQLLEPLNIELSFDFEPGERKIPQSVRQNLYLIFKEAVHNISKHSNATAVRIGLRMTSSNIELAVCDNGTASKKSGTPGRRGNGLRNMQLRADQLNAYLSCGFTATGHEVRVNVPGYRKRFINWIQF